MNAFKKQLQTLIEKANKKKSTLIFFYALLSNGMHQDILHPDSAPITGRELDTLIDIHNPESVLIDDIL